MIIHYLLNIFSVKKMPICHVVRFGIFFELVF